MHVSIKIPIYNPANKDIKLQRKTIIGQLEFISVAVQVEIKQSKFPEVNKLRFVRTVLNDFQMLI